VRGKKRGRQALTQVAGIVGRRELEANAAVDHGHRFRVHGEGCGGIEIGGFEEVDLHLHASCLIAYGEIISPRPEFLLNSVNHWIILSRLSFFCVEASPVALKSLHGREKLAF
jgi:hypothetical protein